MFPKKILMTVLLLLSTSALAYDTEYKAVVELKGWKTVTDVYMVEKHTCPNQTHYTRYLLGKEDKEQFSLLLAALTTGKKVSLSYRCNSSGHPAIEGVRLKQ